MTTLEEIKAALKSTRNFAGHVGSTEPDTGVRYVSQNYVMQHEDMLLAMEGVVSVLESSASDCKFINRALLECALRVKLAPDNRP